MDFKIQPFLISRPRVFVGCAVDNLNPALERPFSCLLYQSAKDTLFKIIALCVPAVFWFSISLSLDSVFSQERWVRVCVAYFCRLPHAASIPDVLEGNACHAYDLALRNSTCEKAFSRRVLL